ncbi:hypothetical protein F5B22DRAFT_642980 [Xylaria bambusicola]|uniref:uncharacterized protein n=1 Tax=Xylaria bambusicola TaxID=326684 RepID=UPI002007ECDF|nr:uncharacterized protein F5B22DRAFT_642980 [Xylaria bambusicola]KAI0523878.1 hypothetical protein F5B22DRAFT_642980 [Xylaria bambusicola]
MVLNFFPRRQPSKGATPVHKLQLHVIYDPETHGNSVAEIDLVLVHGFGGHYMDTWTSKQGDSSVFWPEDLLLKQETQPPTRILSFGYDVGELVVASIRSYAQSMLTFLNDLREGIESRPVVFLGHCLGGLIVKQAMRFAENEPSLKSIISATKSIMFFGTPHGGGEKKDWRKLATCYKELGSKCQMIAVLGKSTDDLTELDEDFLRLQNRFTINNFLEQRKMPGAKRLIVDQTSAVKFSGAGSTGVDGDHVTMCQFKDAHNNAFTRVCRIIRDAVFNEVATNHLITPQTPRVVDNRVVINQEFVFNQVFVVNEPLVIDGQADMRANHQGAAPVGVVGTPDLPASIERQGVWSVANRRMLEQKKEKNAIEELFESSNRDCGEQIREWVRSSQRDSKV